VDAPGFVEHAIFGEDLIDGCAPTRGGVFTARPSISVTGARPTRSLRKRGKEKWERSPEIL
jgi:hypothetical protein